MCVAIIHYKCTFLLASSSISLLSPFLSIQFQSRSLLLYIKIVLLCRKFAKETGEEREKYNANSEYTMHVICPVLYILLLHEYIIRISLHKFYYTPGFCSCFVSSFFEAVSGKSGKSSSPLAVVEKKAGYKKRTPLLLLLLRRAKERTRADTTLLTYFTPLEH